MVAAAIWISPKCRNVDRGGFGSYLMFPCKMAPKLFLFAWLKFPLPLIKMDESDFFTFDEKSAVVKMKIMENFPVSKNR